MFSATYMNFQIKLVLRRKKKKEKPKVVNHLPQHRPPLRTHETFDIVFRHPHNSHQEFYRDM